MMSFKAFNKIKLKTEQNVTALGIMSGTSLDGLDLALCEYYPDQGWQYVVIKSATFSYNEAWRQLLESAPTLSGVNLIKCSNDFTNLVAQKIAEFCAESPAPDLIAAHGHTVFHVPEEGYTLQILNGELLATLCGKPVVCDFRSKDVALGGQGAPLVPVADKQLFGSFDACLNLGGIANISYDQNDVRLAFDICPANMALNYFARQLEMEYDSNGEIAKSGTLLPELLNQLNQLEFYGRPAPKSLGREWLEARFLPPLLESGADNADILRTLTEHIAIQIAHSLPPAVSTVLCTGGGAHNAFLIEQIRKHTKAEITVPDPELIDFKEAIAFAFLGVLRLRREVNCHASVTGAARDSCSGVLHLPL